MFEEVYMKLVREQKEQITPEMFGLFFEDINYAADGGLYAEMIENRSFEAKEAHGTPGNFYAVDDYGYAWNPVCKEGQDAPRMQIITGTPLSSVNPHYLRVTANDAEQGFSNKAYDGLCLKKNATYKVSFYARCVDYEGENFIIEARKDGKVYASAKVQAKKQLPYLPFCDTTVAIEFKNPEDAEKINNIKKMDSSKLSREHEWVRYELELEAAEDIRGAAFVLLLDGKGIVEFDLISMIPADAVAGVFRKDLFDTLKAMTPGFIRFPGGCIVEGISLDNRYQWKNTVGELKDRKYIPNLWAFDDNRANKEIDAMRPTASHYGQSYGIGFYEYFLLCELLGAKPLPVLCIGVACQFRTTELVPMDSPEFQTYVQDALDLIEFANGPVTSKWGALRARMGHPEPFGMDMIGIGNEQWETEHVDLFARYKYFEKAIHDVYPDMKLVGTAGPIWDMPITEQAWEVYRKEFSENKDFCYAADEHYYVSPEWMYEHIKMYDEYPREVAVFAGEYAAHTKDRANSMESAIAEAAFMTGLEMNAGVIKLSSYAPLFNRIGHSQWTPDMIWFDDEQVYLTPNYYVQKLYANHVGAYTIKLDQEELDELRKKGIYVSVSENLEQKRIIKVANASSEEVVLPLLDENGEALNAMAKIWELQATEEYKGAELPQKSEVCEKEMQIDGSIQLAPMSFVVIEC